MASWYGEDFHGRLTANGEVFDMKSISAAHPTLPIPSYARVTNLRNNRSLIVRVNDRGPYHGNRVIDVSVRAAKLLGFHGYGVDAGAGRVRRPRRARRLRRRQARGNVARRRAGAGARRRADGTAEPGRPFRRNAIPADGAREVPCRRPSVELGRSRRARAQRAAASDRSRRSAPADAQPAAARPWSARSNAVAATRLCAAADDGRGLGRARFGRRASRRRLRAAPASAFARGLRRHDGPRLYELLRLGHFLALKAC